jgi:hypothetical protein
MRKTLMAFTDQEIADLKTALSLYLIALTDWQRVANADSDPDRAEDHRTEFERIRALYSTVEYFQKGGE